MRLAALFFAGGHAFYFAMLLLAASAPLLAASRHCWRRLGALLFISGSLIHACSATLALAWIPLMVIPGLGALVAGQDWQATTGPFLWKLSLRQIHSSRERIIFAGSLATLVVSLAAGLIQSFQSWPASISVPEGMMVHVIGDSLSAGLREGEGPPWPDRLQRFLKTETVNHAQPGATTRSALRQAEELPAECFVLIEIGGNDLLSGMSSDEFARRLEELLSRVCRPSRTVAMFELPLPPFCNGYGTAQRAAAQRHSVSLIPRRVLASVVFHADDATLDSLHLSDSGHQMMAARIAGILQRSPMVAATVNWEDK
jgi:lysophospholipase L1-like esterase